MTDASHKRLLIDLQACDHCYAEQGGCAVDCGGLLSVREQATFELVCRRCAVASCVLACPFGALERTDDGIIKRHNMRCVSCKSCALACPFGVIPDEFVRHKILDLLGDLNLLGFPIRGRIVANMTSHGYNQALVERLHQAIQQDS